MDWLEIIIHCQNIPSDLVSDCLMALGSNGVAIQDIEDYLKLPSAFGVFKTDDVLEKYGDSPIVKGYFSAEMDQSALKEAVAEKLQVLDPAWSSQGLSINRLEDQSWASNWQDYYQPIQVNHWLSIIPVWEKASHQSDTHAIYLDPGMAFGTGDHPTTQLAIHLMGLVLKKGDRVIDVGTGSGILAITAKRLGAQSVAAYDYDESIIETAKANINLNAGMDQVTVQSNDKLNGIHDQVDVITANILADILLPLIPQAYDNLKDNGSFILSGIYYTEVDKLKEALITNDFYLPWLMRAGDWFGILAKKGREHKDKNSL
ncbi:50S ribosomal protein L11 methyltransferase [Aerococcus urinae]|uniref:Ribosomal protein L11 methyltransferase n=1 Tax=Aerococcus urinae TaxID=1376 RepID=A0ABT4C236_9LACT|nr:50S ribosomal protein L11 methyltransferase [Aerococcus urinae]MCY3052495.1 50S ribosomal protein L11 methyltransferase [Aerococcus urinae]